MSSGGSSSSEPESSLFQPGSNSSMSSPNMFDLPSFGSTGTDSPAVIDGEGSENSMETDPSEPSEGYVGSGSSEIELGGGLSEIGGNDEEWCYGIMNEEEEQPVLYLNSLRVMAVDDQEDGITTIFEPGQPSSVQAKLNEEEHPDFSPIAEENGTSDSVERAMLELIASMEGAEAEYELDSYMEIPQIADEYQVPIFTEEGYQTQPDEVVLVTEVASVDIAAEIEGMMAEMEAEGLYSVNGEDSRNGRSQDVPYIVISDNEVSVEGSFNSLVPEPPSPGFIEISSDSAHSWIGAYEEESSPRLITSIMEYGVEASEYAPPVTHLPFSTETNQGSFVEGVGDSGYGYMAALSEEDINAGTLFDHMNLSDNVPYDPLMAMLDAMLARGELVETKIRMEANSARNEKKS